MAMICAFAASASRRSRLRAPALLIARCAALRSSARRFNAASAAATASAWSPAPLRLRGESIKRISVIRVIGTSAATISDGPVQVPPTFLHDRGVRRLVEDVQQPAVAERLTAIRFEHAVQRAATHACIGAECHQLAIALPEGGRKVLCDL